MTDSGEVRDVTRRNFLRGLAGAAGATIAIAALEDLAANPDKALASYEAQIALAAKQAGLSTTTGQLDILERMHQELARAIVKPASDRRWVMVIDLRKCVGCHACTIACVAENKLPPGVVYRPILEEETGDFPNVKRQFIPRPCMQCDNPPCVPVCPVEATYKNEDGVVVVDYEQCIGCRACLAACPYGARTSDFGYTYIEDTIPKSEGLIVGREAADDYERAANYEYGKAWSREDEDKSPRGNARKCHFCLHRVKVGELPACVTTCIGRATMFGDAKDSDSLVSEMIAQPNVMRLKEEMGTEPRVYYLV